MKRLLPFVLLVSLSACAHARHAAVVVDLAFVQSVTALDDAELQACTQGILNPQQCADANPKIRRALEDARAVTAAVQATPKNVAVPKNLPDLLADLTEVQNIIGTSGLPAGPVLAKAQAAINQALALLRLYAQVGGDQ